MKLYSTFYKFKKKNHFGVSSQLNTYEVWLQNNETIAGKHSILNLYIFSYYHLLYPYNAPCEFFIVPNIAGIIFV